MIQTSKPLSGLPRMFAALAVLVLLSGCYRPLAPQPRMGMVTDPETNLMYGSTIEKNLVTDASFYNNRKIKVKTRNTSGDVAFGLREFTDSINAAYGEKGYTPSSEDGFGLLVDVNVLHSGHIQRRSIRQYSFLGALAGSMYGERTMGPIDPALGAVSGAAIGSIIGRFVTEDTYMIVAHVTFGVVKKAKKTKKRVTLSRSKKLKNIDDPDEEEEVYARGFKKVYTTHLAVYAGGLNVAQDEIAAEVKNRVARIVGEFL